MMRISKVLGAIFAIAACGASAVASADNPANPAGFYIGAGLGWSQIRSDNPQYGYPGYYNYQFAWQGMLGIRPIKYLGVEAQYIDFGQPYHGCCGYYYNVNASGNDSHPTAPAIFGVAYLPIPVPFVDFFAKMGAARLSTNVLTPFLGTCTGVSCPIYSRQEVTDTKFAWGAGVQSKFPYGLILRGSYERIASSYGDPSALMFSAMWQF
jgi:opacity protein-like surface antigen